MKFILSLIFLWSSVFNASGVENDVWYNAAGEVVKVTRAEQPKIDFVPIWEKREAQRAAMQKNREQRTRSSYGYPSYDYEWRCRSPYYGRLHGNYHYPYRRGSHFRFNGTFHGRHHGTGWSVRVGF